MEDGVRDRRVVRFEGLEDEAESCAWGREGVVSALSERGKGGERERNEPLS